jgi:hypothetical protein
VALLRFADISFCCLGLLALAAGCDSGASVVGIDIAASWVTAEASNVALNGQEQAAVNVHLARADGTPLAGQDLEINVPSCGSVAVSGTTDTAGNARLTVGCSHSQSVGIAPVLRLGNFTAPLPRATHIKFYAPTDGRRGADAPGSEEPGSRS